MSCSTIIRVLLLKLCWFVKGLMGSMVITDGFNITLVSTVWRYSTSSTPFKLNCRGVTLCLL